jgi:hypothetical protein
VQARDPADEHIRLTDELLSLIDPEHPRSPVQDPLSVAQRLDSAPSVRGTPYTVADVGGTVAEQTLQALADSVYASEIATTTGQSVNHVAHIILPRAGVGTPPPSRLFLSAYNGALGLHIPGRAIGVNPWLHDVQIAQAVATGTIDTDDRSIVAAAEIVSTIVHEMLHQAGERHGRAFDVKMSAILQHQHSELAPLVSAFERFYARVVQTREWQADVQRIRDEYNAWVRQTYISRGYGDSASAPVDATSLFWSAGSGTGTAGTGDPRDESTPQV